MKKTSAFFLMLILVAPAPTLQAFDPFLDGSTLPEAPWLQFLGGDEDQQGETLILDFVDPVGGTNNQALRLNSGTGANEWFIEVFNVEEAAAGARFRVVDFSPTGKENFLCLTTRSKHLAPAPSITIVDGRFKLWNYVESDSEIMDIGPVVTNVFHTVYLYARTDGLVKLWWDGKLMFDAMAPLVNPYNGYFEWGSGSWQFDAADTIDFDWVGFGTVADLPLALTTTPTHGTIFHNASDGLQITAISQIDSAPGIATNGLSLTINGADRSSELSISGNDQNRQASFSGLMPDQVYRVLIKATDVSGAASSYPLEFDTFRTNHMVIEAEDFNFEGGQFLDQVVLGSAPAPDNYIDRVGIEGVDHHELSTEPGNMPHRYRADSLVSTDRNIDAFRPDYAAAQAVDAAVADFSVGSIEVGEWLNYTRTFAPGTYHVYARLASGNMGTNFVASLDKVTNPTSAEQTVTALGAFRGGPGRGWQTYDFVPLTDAQGNVVSVPLSGVETLRVTAVENSYNANFYMFVPVPPTTSPTLHAARANQELVLTWTTGVGLILETTDRLGDPWTPVPNPTSPYRVPLSGTMKFFRLR